MVYLVLEAAAVSEAIDIAKQSGAAVWVGSDALTDDELLCLRVEKGLNLTRFTYPLSHASSETIEKAIATVVEHHPNETLWIQHPALP